MFGNRMPPPKGGGIRARYRAHENDGQRTAAIVFKSKVIVIVSVASSYVSSSGCLY